MKNHHLVALLLAGSVGLAASAIAVATAAPAPPAPPPPLQILDFKPAFDDLMTMLVQPRHTKLWIAAQQKNWQLAGFQLNEMGGALRRVGQTIPKYRNISVEATVSSIFTPKIQAVAGAIAAQNAAQFNTAYAELTNACNLCHEALEHPFLVIKVPDASAAVAFPDQDFRPVAGAK
ncbi:MAG TPA: hypothetical protein VK479_11040 [Micropepsaceae bacterium]|nr:hypothetical protein [Micropepsaceae bacterium]